MTDKEIIIDGVNVARCERHCSDNYNRPNMCYCYMTNGYRSCNPKENQCSFYITSIEKQLTHKTEMYNKVKEDLGLLNGKLYAKEQECEELKERLDNVQDDCPSFGDCSYVQCVKDERDRYQQALDKIAEIAKNIVIIGGYEKDKNINSCKVCPNQELDVDELVCDLDCRKGQTMLSKQILTIINEVKDAD